MKPKTIIVILIVLIVVIALFQNAESIYVKILFWQFSASAFIMYLVFYVLGAISAIIWLLWRKI
jgi:uncharacterized integral membrane protein